MNKGTEKAYLYLLKITKSNGWQRRPNHGFVQFHPAYDLYGFVEGLRPVSNGDGAIEFKLEDGI